MKSDAHSAAVVLLRKDGYVLMQLRDNKTSIVFPNHWCVPGGRVEKNENFKQAAIRELEEETGVKISDATPIWEEIYQADDGRWINRHIFFAMYDGEQKIACYEGQKMEFVNPKNFSKMLIYPGHEKIIKKAIEKARELKLLSVSV